MYKTWGPEQKWALVVNAKKSESTEGEEGKPIFWVNKLRHDATLKVLEKITFYVGHKGVNWIEAFDSLGGIQLLADMLAEKLKTIPKK
jgi:hypothetical protein